MSRFYRSPSNKSSGSNREFRGGDDERHDIDNDIIKKYGGYAGYARAKAAAAAKKATVKEAIIGKTFKQFITEVAKAVSPSDKAAVAQFKVKKTQFVDYPELQFKGTAEKDDSIDADAPEPSKSAAKAQTPGQ